MFSQWIGSPPVLSGGLQKDCTTVLYIQCNQSTVEQPPSKVHTYMLRTLACTPPLKHKASSVTSAVMKVGWLDGRLNNIT